MSAQDLIRAEVLKHLADDSNFYQNALDFIATHHTTLNTAVPDWFDAMCSKIPIASLTRLIHGLDPLVIPHHIVPLSAHISSKFSTPDFFSWFSLLEPCLRKPLSTSDHSLLSTACTCIAYYIKTTRQPASNEYLSIEPEPLDFNTDFSPDLLWFRNSLAMYSPLSFNELEQSLRIIASNLHHNPHIAADFSTQLCQNLFLNSYQEIEFYARCKSDLSQAHSIPDHVQSPDYSNQPHPILQRYHPPSNSHLNSHPMHSVEVVQTQHYQLYFLIMFCIGNVFTSLVDEVMSSFRNEIDRINETIKAVKQDIFVSQMRPPPQPELTAQFRKFQININKLFDNVEQNVKKLDQMEFFYFPTADGSRSVPLAYQFILLTYRIYRFCIKIDQVAIAISFILSRIDEALEVEQQPTDAEIRSIASSLIEIDLLQLLTVNLPQQLEQICISQFHHDPSDLRTIQAQLEKWFLLCKNRWKMERPRPSRTTSYGCLQLIDPLLYHNEVSNTLTVRTLNSILPKSVTYFDLTTPITPLFLTIFGTSYPLNPLETEKLTQYIHPTAHITIHRKHDFTHLTSFFVSILHSGSYILPHLAFSPFRCGLQSLCKPGETPSYHELDEFNSKEVENRQLQRHFLYSLINHSYQLYQNNLPTLMQFMLLHTVQFDPSIRRLYKGCRCLFNFLLFGPFLLFTQTQDYALLQQHIILCAHAGFLSPYDDLAKKLNIPECTPAKQSMIKSILLPYRALVYSWLMVKSGLQHYFPTPTGDDGPYNLLLHAIVDWRYCCHDIFLQKLRLPARNLDIGVINTISTGIENPLLSNHITSQYKTIVVDSDGYFILAVEKEKDGDQTKAFDMNNPADFNGIHVLQLDDPFAFPLFYHTFRKSTLGEKRALFQHAILPVLIALRGQSKLTDLVEVEAQFGGSRVQLCDNTDEGEDQGEDQNGATEPTPLLPNPSYFVPTPGMVKLQQHYQRYLTQINQFECDLVKKHLRVVLKKAHSANLLNPPISTDSIHSYPYPSPTNVPQSMPVQYKISTQPQADSPLFQYHQHLSSWCIEMLLAMTLGFQQVEKFEYSHCFDLNHNTSQPEQFEAISINASENLDSTSQSPLSPDLITLLRNHLAQSNQRWMSPVEENPDAQWLLEDSFTQRILTTTLASYTALVDLLDEDGSR